MKYLLLVVAVAVLLTNCNPLDFGETTMIHMESDELTTSFECNNQVVEDWSGWFEWSLKDGVYQVDKIRVDVARDSEHIIIGFTLYNPLHVTSAKYKYNAIDYARIKKVVKKGVVLTNLKMWK